MPDRRPKLALLGAGIFVRTAYVPSLRELSELVSLHTIWSRSEQSATDTSYLVKDFAPDVIVKWGDGGLNEILQDETIHCIAVVLSANFQLDIVLKALLAGKHVLQEKPVGACVSDVRDVFSTYKSLSMEGRKPPIWAVAENYRFETGINEAAKWVKEIGDLISVQVTAHEPMNKGNIYFDSVTTSWRKGFKGGLPLDGGVHYIAATKLMLGAGIKCVAAIAKHTDSNLAPPDTVSSLLQFSNGCAGLLLMSWNGQLQDEAVWRVLGSKGEVRVERVSEDGKMGYKVHLIPVNGGTAAAAAAESRSNFHPISGVTEELRAFAADVAKVLFEGMEPSSADPRGSVQEAIDDVAVIEAVFKSSASIESFAHVEQLDIPS